MIQKTKERNTFRCIIAVAVMLACTAASYAQESGKSEEENRGNDE